MNKLIFPPLLFLSVICCGTAASEKILLISKDSIQGTYNYLDKGWRFHNGDDSAMSSPSYDDRQWKESATTLYLPGDPGISFNSIGWFRLHFTADSTVTGRPIALTMTHFGASEIYLDGRLIKSFGWIKGVDSSVYFDPQELPFVFTIQPAGEHVLAVRYANYDAEKNYKTYKRSFAGFKMMVGETREQISWKDQRSTIAAFVLMLLSGIFIALCLIHLFMFLYYRSARSNLYFSAFMFSLSAIFIILFVNYASHSPSLEVTSFSLINPLSVFSCIALAGFINELFHKKKWRFMIMVALGIAALLVRFLGNDLYLVLTMVLIISVSFDSLFTVVFAMIKKVKGSRIIGAGILISTLFVLTIFSVSFANGGYISDVNDSTIGGRILILFLGFAILSIPLSMSVYLAWSFSSMNRKLSLQLEQVNVLSRKSLEHELEKQRLLENKQQELESEVIKRTAELSTEKKKSDDLLLNILPSEVAEELKAKGRTNAKTYSMVTVMFTDFKDFTDVSEKISAELLVEEIHHCFSAFDHIIQKYRIEKIKTIGDAYICAAGLPVLNFTHATDMINAALEIRNFMLNRKKEKEAKGEIPFELRIGINTGPVVAGIVGVKKFAYDIWGDTVNVAARMESGGEAGKVNVSGSTYELVKEKFRCTHRGKIPAKNKGEIDMYFVEPVS